MTRAESSNVAVVRRLYDARGNPDVLRQVLASDVRWDVTEGFPRSGVYEGIDDLLENFFGPLFQAFETFQADAAEFIECGNRVVALGYYVARTRTGRQVTSRFAHVWTVRDDRIAALRQVADTLPFAHALDG